MSRSLALVVAVGTFVGSAQAQTAWRYGGNTVLTSRYEYRGVARHNGFAIHNQLFLSYGRANWASVGVWTTAEPSADRDTRYFGNGRSGFGEVDVWFEVSGRTDLFRLTVGGVHHAWNFGTNARWPEPAANPRTLPTFAGTQELRAQVAGVGLGRLIPRVAWMYDVGEVQGAYLEYGATLRIPMWTGVALPAHSLLLGGVLGHNLGQHPDGGQVGYYADPGLTHLDLSLGTTLGPFGPAVLGSTLIITGEAHYQIGWDPATQASAANMNDGTRIWFRLGLGWAGPTCQPDRSICP